jgi:putative DNA primase/helicase
MTHPYVRRKKVSPGSEVRLYRGDERRFQGALMVPVIDIDGALRCVQYISADGGKLFRKGAQVRGHFCPIPNLDALDGAQTIALCEGWATARSVYECTGWPAICCFGAWNLYHVARTLRSAFRDARLVFCADRDEKGIGEAKAATAARATSKPTAVALAPHGKDWNDVHCAFGVRRTGRLLREAIDV